MNGGGGVFNVPLEAYGLPALGQALGQLSEIPEQRKKKKNDEMMRELNLLNAVEAIHGKGSTQYAAKAAQIGEMMGMEAGGSAPLVSVPEIQTRNLNDAYAAYTAGTATPDQVALVEQALTGNPLGMGAVVEGARNVVTTGRQAVTSGDQTIKRGEQQIEAGVEDLRIQRERREALAGQGFTPGGMLASMDILNMQTGEVEIAGGKLRNKLYAADVANAPLQRSILSQQLSNLQTEALALTAKANNPFAEEDANYIAGLSAKLMNAGMIPQSAKPVSYVVAGLEGQLPKEQQAQFDAGYSQFANEQRQVWLGELAKLQEEDPNSPRAVAARNLTVYYEAQKANGGAGTPGLEDISDDQIAKWTATALGGTVTREGGFWNKFVFGFQEGQPMNLSTPDTPRFDPNDLETYSNSAISANGVNGARAVLEQQREAMNAATPGYGDALIEHFEMLHPDAVADPAEVAAPTRRPSARAPIENTPPMPMPRDDLIDTDQERISDLTKAREKSSDDPNVLKRIDNRINAIMQPYRARDASLTALNRDMVRLEAEVAGHPAGSLAHRTVQTRLTRVRNQIGRIDEEIREGRISRSYANSTKLVEEKPANPARPGSTPAVTAASPLPTMHPDTAAAILAGPGQANYMRTQPRPQVVTRGEADTMLKNGIPQFVIDQLYIIQ